MISCVGRGIIANQIELLRVADEEESSVRWFFPSEYGTDVEFGPESATERPHQFKLQVRRFVRENVKRVAVTYLVTGPYADMWINIIPLAPAAGGFDWKEKRVVLVEDGEGKIALTTMPEYVDFIIRHADCAISS